MPNLLKMAKVQSILSLHAQGRSQREIARTLQVDRGTVRKYLLLGLSEPKPAIAPAGLAGSKPAAPGTSHEPADAPIGAMSPPGDPKPAIAPTGSGPLSKCAPFRRAILAKAEEGLSAQRIYQDLAADGAAVSYDSVRRYLRRLGHVRPLPFRRMECAAGEEAQVDFGTGAPLIGPDGKRQKTHVFRIVLSHSRKGYSEVTLRQTTDDFLGALENAFRHFGGVPKTISRASAARGLRLASNTKRPLSLLTDRNSAASKRATLSFTRQSAMPSPARGALPLHARHRSLLAEEPLHRRAHRLNLAGRQLRTADLFKVRHRSQPRLGQRARAGGRQHFFGVGLERREAPGAVIVRHQLHRVEAARPEIRVLRRDWKLIAADAAAVERAVQPVIVQAMMAELVAAVPAAVLVQAMAAAATVAGAAAHRVIGNRFARPDRFLGGKLSRETERRDQGRQEQAGAHGKLLPVNNPSPARGRRRESGGRGKY
jgi:hypothetical protein